MQRKRNRPLRTARLPHRNQLPAAQSTPIRFRRLTLDGLAATRELPLFTPSRSPPPVVEEPVADEPVVAAPAQSEPVVEEPPPAVQLIGIILTDSKQTAILRNSSTDEVLRLSPGEEVENWALTIVDARSIELRRGDRIEGLKMFELLPRVGHTGDAWRRGPSAEHER